jgi:UDP:flavonoid glycosyltransferase YjiC (YdhE family)
LPIRGKGHQVICAFPEQFRDLAEGAHMEFASLSTGFIDLLNGAEGKAALGGNGSLNGIRSLQSSTRRPEALSKRIQKRPAWFILCLISPMHGFFREPHHGGSGTTHLALKYGCASLIIPPILDQFVWNKIVHGIGAGPQGIKIGKLSMKKLEPKILDLMNNAAYKKKAEGIADGMRKEDFLEELYTTIIDPTIFGSDGARRKKT